MLEALDLGEFLRPFCLCVLQGCGLRLLAAPPSLRAADWLWGSWGWEGQEGQVVLPLPRGALSIRSRTDVALLKLYKMTVGFRPR